MQAAGPPEEGREVDDEPVVLDVVVVGAGGGLRLELGVFLRLRLQHLAQFFPDVVDDLVEVVVELVLQFLVVTATLIGRAFPECLRKAIEDCELATHGLGTEVFPVVLEELKVDFGLSDGPGSRCDPFLFDFEPNPLQLIKVRKVFILFALALDPFVVGLFLPGYHTMGQIRLIFNVPHPTRHPSSRYYILIISNHAP